jgi:hypothetical protein
MIQRKTPLKRSTKPIARSAIKRTQKAASKPKGHPRHYEAPKPAVRVYDDGREVCDLSTAAGKAEYKHRVDLMAERQNQVCCLYGYIKECLGSLIGYLPTFEHEDGRGGGKRDDRIEVDGKRKNGAAHCLCNSIKGSRFIDYNEGKS